MSEKRKNKVIKISDFKKSEIDFDKKEVDLRTLKELIRSGLYKPSSDKIAESMLEKNSEEKVVKKKPKNDK